MRLLSYIIVLGLVAICFLGIAQQVKAESWSGSCALTSSCPGIIAGDGEFRADGFYPTSETGYAFFSSADDGIASLDVAQGRIEFDVKGLDVRTIPQNSLYISHIHRIPWNGCKDDFWYTLKLTGGNPSGGLDEAIWAQGFDYNVKQIGAPAGGFPSGWHHVTLTWNNTGWTQTIDGVGATSGIMNYELDPREQEIMIGVGSEIDGATRQPVAEPGSDPGWGYGLFDMFGTGIEVAYRNFEWSFTSGSTNNPNAEDSEFCTEETDLAFGGCGCIGSTDFSVAPCSEKPKQPAEMNEDAAYFEAFVLGWLWKLEDIVDNVKHQGDELQKPPELTLQAASPGLIPGTEVSFVVAAEYYRTRFSNIYFAWCVYNSSGGPAISYNSVVAGGEVAEVASNVSVPTKAGSCCDWLTRTPAVDTDNDGMDDYWEEEKFVGRTFEGVSYTSIEQVLPNQDPDADGYFANRFENRDTGEFVTVTPGLVDSLGNQYNPGDSRAQLTNIEEYILQTDPLNGDTDGDGIIDGEDYIGVGQQYLSFTADKFLGIGGYMDVIVSAVGVDQLKSVHIVQGTQRLHVTPIEQFKIELAASSEVLPVGASSESTVTIAAQLTQGQVDESTLDYTWILNGENICEEANYPELVEFCGQGKSTLTLGGDGPLSFFNLPGLDDLEIGEEYKISVEVIDQVTRQQSSAETALQRATTLELTTECGAENGDVVPINDNGELTICVASYGVEVAEKSAMTYLWYRNGQFDQTQSGLGKNTFKLTGSGLANEDIQVSLKAKFNETAGGEMAGSIQIPTVGPTVTFTEPADRFRTSDAIADEETLYLPVRPGDTVEMVAEAMYFGEQTNYTWTWTNDNATNISNSDIPSSSYSFSVPDDFTDGDSMLVTVAVRAEDETGVLTDASDGMMVVVSPEAGQLGDGGNIMGAVASVFSFLSPQAKLSIQVALMIIGAAGVVAGAMFIFRIFFGGNYDQG